MLRVGEGMLGEVTIHALWVRRIGQWEQLLVLGH